MKAGLTLLFTLITGPLFCQSVPSRVLGSFIFNDVPYNYEFTHDATDNYSFRITIAGQQSTVNGEAEESTNPPGTDTTGGASADAYIFAYFHKDVFEAVFKRQMIEKFRVADSQVLKDKSTEIFFLITAKLEFVDDEPITANLILRRDMVFSFIKVNNSAYYTGPLSKLIAKHKVERVDIEIEDGAIKNLKLRVIAPNVQLENASPRSYLEFKNIFPISISGKYDSDYFSDVRVYCLNCSGIPGLQRFIRLSDLLLLDIVLQNDKEDYSPTNSTLVLTPSSVFAELKKERRSKILEIAAFTDFVGLDQQEPNGLIQVEAKRRINIVTKYKQVRRFDGVDDIANQLNLSDMEEGIPVVTKKETIYTLLKEKKDGEPAVLAKKNIKVSEGTLKNGRAATKLEVSITNRQFHSSYWTFASFIEPRLLFSKLEENNRFVEDSILKDKKVDPVLLYQYQLASFGAMLNLIRFSYPQLKFSWNALSVGGYWFRTRVGDSSGSNNEESVPLNSSYISITSEAIFRPDSRWGATLGINWMKSSLWDEEYSLLNDHSLLQPYFESFLKTNDNNKLFFRFRWTFEQSNRENNFTQIQLGYNINLFAPNAKL